MRIDLYANWSNARQGTVTDLPDDLPREEIVKRSHEAMQANRYPAHTAAIRTDEGAPLLFVYRDGRVREPQL
ncbi:hypothetical protein ACLQ16_03815 [Streptomyces albidoflavus]|uniref:hypothetical protein n=1 Tax=Streptomyces albidoflavus TaxID=1886 RepID=UPI000A1C97D0|nr:hypothetical protein [Streptomyces albidoflavus]